MLWSGWVLHVTWRQQTLLFGSHPLSLSLLVPLFPPCVFVSVFACVCLFWCPEISLASQSCVQSALNIQIILNFNALSVFYTKIHNFCFIIYPAVCRVLPCWVCSKVLLAGDRIWSASLLCVGVFQCWNGGFGQEDRGEKCGKVCNYHMATMWDHAFVFTW